MTFYNEKWDKYVIKLFISSFLDFPIFYNKYMEDASAHHSLEA